ncbi:unnamed protein product, partial [Meganyctiphanes norvegica]
FIIAGDPDDKTLRRVEIEVVIPKKMRDIAREEHCSKEVAEFTKCCHDSSYGMVIKCRPQNTKLWDCLTHWYNDEGLRERCKNEFLEERSEFRRTGLTKKQRKLQMSGF